MAIEVFFRAGWLEVGRGSETEVQVTDVRALPQHFNFTLDDDGEFGNEVIGLEAHVRGNPFAH